MQRLQLDPEEKLTRKEYFKRKKKQAKSLKKRSKVTYIMAGVIALLCIYVCTQFYVYSKANNFKYVEGEGVNKQKVYNVYYVTEGYTYDPVYSLNSINSDGFHDVALYDNSGLSDILVDDKYVYGLKEHGLYRLPKGTQELEQLVEKDIVKYTLQDGRIYFTSGENNDLKYVSLETKEIKDLGINHISEILVDKDNIFVVQDEKTKKTLVKYDKEGQNKQVLTVNSNVSYIIQDETTIYYVNKRDGNKIYRVGKDGKDEIKLDDITSVSDKGKINEVDGSKYMFVQDKSLFYINVSDNNTLWRINLENKEKEKVISVPIQILQNVEDTVFYKVKNEMGVYLYNYNTKFMSQVTKRKMKEFCVDAVTPVDTTNRQGDASKN